jgi:hypothetical protein
MLVETFPFYTKYNLCTAVTRFPGGGGGARDYGTCHVMAEIIENGTNRCGAHRCE